jgi:hypothetical protein
MKKTEKQAHQIATRILEDRPNHYRGRRKWARARMVKMIVDTLEDPDPLDADLLQGYENEQEARLSLAEEAATEWFIESWMNRE